MTKAIHNLDFGKIPPQAVEVESAILGALMIDANCVYIAMAKLFPGIFYSEAHQKVFAAIQGLYDINAKIDLLTVVERLKKNNDLEVAGGAYYVSKLTNAVISGANIEDHIRLVAEVYLKRESIRLGGELITEAYDAMTDPFDIINAADAGFQKIQEQVITGASKDIAYFGMKVMDQHSTTKTTGILGIPTGLNGLDSVICGLVAPDLIIIAARPGQGKTALALSVTYNTSVIRDIPCAWFSLEMDGIQLVRRLASIDSGIDHEKIRRAGTSTYEENILRESIDRISSKKIFIEDKPGITVRHIRTRANLLKKRHGIKYVVVDYLQLMRGIDAKNSNRESIVSEISRSLKELAKELELPVIALSQLSREVEKRPDKMPQLSDLRESGGIEQDADEVIFLMRPEYYDMTESVQMGEKEFDVKGLAIVKTAKNRHGDTKNTPLYFLGECMKFSDHLGYKATEEAPF